MPKLLPYVARRANELMELFAKHAEEGSAAELDSYFMDTTMDIINYYLYGRHDLNYDLVGGRTNLKVNHIQRKKSSLVLTLLILVPSRTSWLWLSVTQGMAAFWYQQD